MRHYFNLFVILSVAALVLAAPVVKKGDVKLARLQHFTPPDPLDPKPNSTPNSAERHLKSHRRTQKQHPLIVVSDVENDKVKVAMLSHRHPTHVPTKPASDYGDFKGSSIRVDPPKTVHISKLKDAKPEFGPTTVEPDKLRQLIDHINENCHPEQKLANCHPGEQSVRQTESSTGSSSRGRK